MASVLDNCEPIYSIKFFDRGGNSMDGPSNIQELTWSRILDDSSDATMQYIISDDSCCSILGDIEPYAHEVGVFRNEKLVWYGWVLNVEYKRNEVNIDAFDALGWLKRRLVHTTMTWADVDLSDIFLDLWNDAMAPSPIRAQVVTTSSGVRESRESKTNTNRATWASVKEMLDTGLDVTTFGQTVLAGIIHTTKPIEIFLPDVDGDVALTKLGSEYANRIIVDSSNTIRAIYPPNVEPTANSYYPLVEETIYDPQLQDQVSAENAAKSRYEYSRRVPRVIRTQDSLVLQPNFDININDLIPGIRVIVDTKGLCYETKQEFRLGMVNVTVSGGQEKVAVSLQPTGPRDMLDSAEDPIL